MEDLCKCVICKNEFKSNDENIMPIGLNADRGWITSSKLEYICYKCYQENVYKTRKGNFLVINNEMYYNSEWINWELITDQSDIDYIFNKDYYDISNKFRELNN